MPRFKGEEVCPRIRLTPTLASELSHTDCSCLYAALHFITQLRCIHLALTP